MELLELAAHLLDKRGAVLDAGLDRCVDGLARKEFALPLVVRQAEESALLRDRTLEFLEPALHQLHLALQLGEGGVLAARCGACGTGCVAAGALLNTRQAKRLYAPIVAGGTYDDSRDTTYVVTVSRGGLYAADAPPQIKVTTTTGIDVSGGRVTGVATTRGPIATGAVVNSVYGSQSLTVASAHEYAALLAHVARTLDAATAALAVEHDEETP